VYGATLWHHVIMQKRHQKTLDGIFQKPDRKDIAWDDFLTLLRTLGADIDS
jgi:hypothetical protein